MRKQGAKPTLADVAKKSGVSQTTVSYVLSNSEHAARISTDTKLRITNAARDLGYTRNAIGAALRRGYSDTIVLLAVGWSLANAHSHTTVSLTSAASGSELSTIVHVANDDDHAVDFLEHVFATNPYGIVLLWDSDKIPTDQLSELSERGLPIIDLMPSTIESIPTITADREQGYFEATNHLIGLGHKKIGMVLDTKTRGKTSHTKVLGVKKAMEANEIPFDESFLHETANPGFNGGYHGIRELLKNKPDVTGVVCINDPMALGVIAACKEDGIKVPEDLSVIGQGAFPESSYFHPHLTTLRAPATKIAAHAIESIVSMRKEKIKRPGDVYIPMELMVRESTGPAKKA